MIREKIELLGDFGEGLLVSSCLPFLPSFLAFLAFLSFLTFFPFQHVRYFPFLDHAYV